MFVPIPLRGILEYPCCQYKPLRDLWGRKERTAAVVGPQARRLQMRLLLLLQAPQLQCNSM